MKTMERILAAGDFSALSEEALKVGMYLTQKLNGKFSALHVVNQTPFEGHFFGPISVDLTNQIEAKASEELKSWVLKSVPEGVETTEWVEVGIPYVEIIRYAKQQKIQCL